ANFLIGSNIVTGEQHTLAYDAIDKSGNHRNGTQPAPLILVDVPPQLSLTTVNGKTPLATTNPPGYEVKVTATEQGATLSVSGIARTVTDAIGKGTGVGITQVNWSVEGGAFGAGTLTTTA